jgi:hypothetical protein
MDVNALVARASPTAATPSPPAQPQPPNDAVEPQGAAPAAEQAPPAPYPLKRSPAPPKTSGRALWLGLLAIVIVVVAVAVLLLLPMVVRDRVIASAREAGVELSIEGVGVGFSGVTLRDVKAKATRTPGITASMREVHLVGLSVKDARVLGLEAALEGERTDLEVGLGALVADARARFAGTAAAPHHLSIVDARVVWNGPGGERLSASDVGLEVDSRGPGLEDLRGSAGRFELKTTRTTFGPWSAAVEKTGTTSRVRLMFDPPIPDGPSALFVGHKVGATEVTVKIPRSSFKNLGIRPVDLGLPADDTTDVQISVTGSVSDAESNLAFDVGLWHLTPKGLSGPIDIRTEGTAKNVAGKPFELAKTTVTLGPFVAGVTGTVTPHSGTAFRLDGLFKTTPLPCEHLARSQAEKMGTIAATLQALGQTTGALRVTGAVNASGIVKFDTAEPETATLTWLAKETCGVSIFGM